MKKTILLAAMAIGLFTTNVFAQKIKGSDTCLPVSQTEAENFMNKHKGTKVTVTGGGSGVGISALMEGTTDIAMSSRKMKFDEKVRLQEAKKNAKEVVIAYDAGKNYVEPSFANAKNKTYPIVRPLFYYYEAKNEGPVKPFIDYVLSAEGQEIVKKVGYIPVK